MESGSGNWSGPQIKLITNKNTDCFIAQIRKKTHNEKTPSYGRVKYLPQEEFLCPEVTYTSGNMKRNDEIKKDD